MWQLQDLSDIGYESKLCFGFVWKSTKLDFNFLLLRIWQQILYLKKKSILLFVSLKKKAQLFIYKSIYKKESLLQKISPQNPPPLSNTAYVSSVFPGNITCCYTGISHLWMSYLLIINLLHMNVMFT